MEEDSKAEEPFLKIERTWSEAEQNYENITVKEEDISDVEPETLLKELEENNYSYLTPSEKVGQEIDTRKKDNVEEGKTKGEGDPSEEGKPKEDDIDLKETCLHDAKNFKVVKKRLRCSDCKSILCPECYCTISTSLQTHFSKSDNNNKCLYPCKLCSMIFKANCALQAHVRIHLLDTPYVCPDCGAIYNNIYFLSLHLINKCYHVYKVITNGCKFCLSQNMAPGDYISHIEKTHIKPVYKCSQCGLMFENTTDMNRHLGSSHKNESVMSLSYFCCSMCGNLIISKHLYAKHIKYHQDHSASFQIGYLCSCGHSFNTACGFRNHFKNCSKKGILPPQWTYLQVTLRTHEMLQVQSAMEKSVFLQSESGLISNAAESKNGSAIEKRKLDYYLFEDGDSSEELDESSEGSNMNSSNNESQVDQEQGCRKESGSMNSATSGDVGSKKNENPKGLKLDKKFENRMAVREGTTGDTVESNPTKLPQESAAEVRGQSTSTNELLRGEVSNVEKMSRESHDSSAFLEHSGKGRTNENGDRDGDRNMKVMYDHIPYDHLGYLKTQQCLVLQDKNIRKDGSETRNCDNSDNPLITSPENYIITSVLDEKTGVMRTRKVFIQKSHSEQVEADGNFNVEMEEIQRQQSRKSRNGTFFSCPFCSVLFPKHFSSFHRFRLHLECYHPEAALDITVDRSQLPKSATPFSSIKIRENDLDSDCDMQDLDDVDLQTRLNNLKESSREEDSGNMNLSTSESSNDGSLLGEFTNVDKKKGMSETYVTGRHDFGLRLRNGQYEVGNTEIGRLQSHKNSSKEGCRKNSFSRKINDNSRGIWSQNIGNSSIGDHPEGSCESRTQNEHKLSSNSARSIDDIDENSVSLDSEICSSYNKATKWNDCEDELTMGGSETKNSTTLKRMESRSRRVSEDFRPDDKGYNDRKSEFHDFGGDKERRSKEDGVGSRNLRAKTPVGKEDDDDDFDAETPESEKGKQGRAVERRNSRRESDVWSEFYKTLKIAETLKKTKAKNQEKEGIEDTSIITNYANKRVVKKPKRYRESSDSKDSNEGESNRLDPEEEELYMKKKKLLNRLENVDVRIVDYIFKILERKQRNFGSVKRNTDSNVRGLNRRLLNGGKTSAKLQRTSMDNEEADAYGKEFSDFGGESEWDQQTGTSIEDKGDKRRGRPRKADYLTLKERRRFDYDKVIKLTEKSVEGDDDDFYGKKKKRKLSSKLQYYKRMCGPSDKNDFSSGQVISTMKNSDTEKKLTCAVCKEDHKTEAEFREHIQTHRMDDSSHQCMECGECFVVRPSLEKHLHAFHKIKDVQKYIEENDCSTLDKAEDVESEPLKENQCKVCKDQFPTVHELNKHFRIHGMAFLRQFKKDPKPN